MFHSFYRLEVWIRSWVAKTRKPQIESELIERLSHELRTSLNGIVGYAEFLEMGSNDAMMNFTAKIIRESGQSLTRTSQSFFDFYLLSKSQIRLRFSRFIFADLVRDVVAKNQPLAVDREVSLGFLSASHALESWVNSDLDRMRQVVDALVFGAIQASDKWSMVQLHLDFDEMRGDLLLSIVSSGASVLPSQGYLLTQFWNSDDYRLKLQEGPGIELAFAKAMIQFLNGSVRFEHSTSFPSRLVVRFPANRSFLLKVFS